MSPRKKIGAKGKGKAPRSPYRMLVALAVVGAFGLLYGWNAIFLAPRGQEKDAVQAKVATAKQQETTLRAQLAQLKKLAADTQSREAELARLGRLVPADSDVAGAILALNDTAIQAQVEWPSFLPTPGAPSGAGAPATLGIGMKVSGTFVQVFDYLSRLENLDRLVVVDSVALSGQPDTSGKVKLSADIKARMFSGGSPGPAQAAAGATPTTTTAPATTAALSKAGG